MWITLALVSVLLCCPVQATKFNCTRCESSLGWTDCNLNSTIQSCSGKNGSFQACFRAELTTLKVPANSTFVQGCATKPTFCTDWDAKVSVRQCQLCPEGTPQEPCSVQPPLSEIDLNDGEQVEINVMVTKHEGSRAGGGGPNEGSVVTRQFLATGPNGQPMVVVVLNGSTGSPREAWRPAGPPDVIDWQNEPGVYEIFPYGWNETVDGGAAKGVRFGTGFAVLMAMLSLVVANFC